MGEEPIEMRLVDGIMYMNMGSMSNDKFMKFDLSDPESLPPGMGDLGRPDGPAGRVQGVRARPQDRSRSSARRTSTARSLQHYTLVMDTAKLESLKDLPAEAGVPEEVAYDRGSTTRCGSARWRW